MKSVKTNIENAQDASHQLRELLNAIRASKAQLSCGDGDDYIFILVYVIARGRAWFEPPRCHSGALVVNLDGGYRAVAHLEYSLWSRLTPYAD
jgi:hypothetical protein